MSFKSSDLTLRDWEIASNKLNEFALEVFAGNDESVKAQLLKSINNLTRIKFMAAKVPNEIWMKIMSYLNNKDIFFNFALVNKHFHALTMEPSVLKCLHLEDSASNIAECEDFHRSLLKVIKHSISLVELNIRNVPFNKMDWNTIIKETLKANPGLRSLNVNTDPYDINPDKTLPQLCPEIFKLAKNLQFFQSCKVILSKDVLNEICKLQSLRKLIVTDSNFSITSEFIEKLAFSKNPIEKFKFDSVVGDKNAIATAFSSLYIEKKDTLKSIDFIGTLHLRNGYCGNQRQCVPLPNFNICKNIKRINDILHKHDLELISDLPNLEDLRIKCADLTYVEAFHQMNFSSLKNLVIICNIYTDYESFIAELSKVHFPSLERLAVIKEYSTDWDPSLSENTLERLIKNVPTLSGVCIDSNFVSKITPEFILKMMQEECVIIMNSYYLHPRLYNKKLEKFLEIKGYLIYEKYKMMRKDFSKWWESSKDP